MKGFVTLLQCVRGYLICKDTEHPSFQSMCECDSPEAQEYSSDPEKGTLQYRQYRIADLIAGKHGLEDCTHLLAWGTLPTAKERNKLKGELFSAMTIPSETLDVIRSFP